MTEPDFYRAVTEALEEGKTQTEYQARIERLETEVSELKDMLLETLVKYRDLLIAVNDGMITDSKVPDEGIKRIFAGSCELVDYPAVEKITIKNGYGDPILLTYESTEEILAVLNRWRDMRIWKNSNAKSEVQCGWIVRDYWGKFEVLDDQRFADKYELTS